MSETSHDLLVRRFQGISGLLWMAILTDRALLIDWKRPDDLERYLIPSVNIDWSYARHKNKLANLTMYGTVVCSYAFTSTTV